MYNRRARVLEQRKQQANRRASSVCMTSSGVQRSFSRAQ
ncbi:hypothetical protein GQ600_16647 [Phytophthora cactorum]|nr:hypothetical protein GQ600_16647 [Phytophthora cactorum]